MKAVQLSYLEPSHTDDAIINVASVPQRSPFRYPGGKTWLVPYVRRWLGSLPNRPAIFIEPFAGGAIISLTVAFEKLARHVVMVELDEQVASVWQAILGGDGEWLAKRISDFQLTPENVDKVLSTPAHQLRDRAFQTILKNRINRGGILAPGAGKIKYGEAGRGLASRWYPATLRKRILSISAVRERLTFIHGDGMEVMRRHIQNTQAVFFIDPPYTAGGKRAGRRLYTHSELDHAALFQLASQLTGDFLMTYDEAPEVRDLAHRFGFDVETVAMKSTHHAKLRELLIGRDLDWLR